jgi:hypothetical protein
LLPDTPNYITVPETKTGVPNDLLTQNLRCLLSMSQRVNRPPVAGLADQAGVANANSLVIGRLLFVFRVLFVMLIQWTVLRTGGKGGLKSPAWFSISSSWAKRTSSNVRSASTA